MEILISLGAFTVLLLAGLWVPVALGSAALLYLWLVGGESAFRAIGFIGWDSLNSFTLTAIPMFILMAELLLKSGSTERIYRSLAILGRRLPGGLLQTNIVACAIFAAVSGSSIATAASIGPAAIPELVSRKYDRRLAVGSLAAGGTLGILIPPSLAMIIYATFTGTSVAELFLAGVVPGILLVALFMLYIAGRFYARPSIAPVESEGVSSGNLLIVFLDLLPFAILIAVVLGSLYLGFATPTEAAGVGVVLSFVISAVWGTLDIRRIGAALTTTASITGSIMFIVFAGLLFSYVTTLSGIGEKLINYVTYMEIGKLNFLFLLFLVYIILGFFMDSLAMIVITVPVVYPILGVYDVDPVVFGVLLVLFIELGQISPPFGINLFVIQSFWEGKLAEVIMGAIPFALIILGVAIAITVWPDIVLWLPSNMLAR